MFIGKNYLEKITNMILSNDRKIDFSRELDVDEVLIYVESNSLFFDTSGPIKGIQIEIESNQELLTSWETFSTKEGRPLPHNAISYVICAGAKENNFGAILGLTRNLSTDDLKTANWVDGTKGNHPNGMKLLNENQGQFVTTDGSARRADSLDLKEQTEAHIYRFGDDESESIDRCCEWWLSFLYI